MTELLADTEFAGLRPEVRDALRQMEQEFRSALLNMASQATPELQPHLAAIAEEMPRLFMTGHAIFYQKVSQFMDLGALMEKAEREAAALARRTIQ